MANFIRFIATIIFFFLAVSFLNCKGFEGLQKLDIINQIMLNPKIKDLTFLTDRAKLRKQNIKYIVVHHDAILANTDHFAAISRVHIRKNNWNALSYHYTINQFGDTRQFHYDNENTPHVAGYNDSSIAVCVEGNFDEQKLNERNYKSLILLLISLKKKYPNAEIIGHGGLNSTSCPGKNINIENIRFLVQNVTHFYNL